MNEPAARTGGSPSHNGSVTLAVDNLCVVRGGRDVLTGVTFEASEGMLILAGPNGAGKTSLIRILATLDLPTSGTVHIDGEELTSTAGARRARVRLGYLPQQMRFPGNFTAMEAVTYASWLARVAPSDRASASRRSLRAFGGGHLAERRLSSMSAGERQRVFLAQATVHRPSLLLLDEPTAAVDPEQRALLRGLLRDWSSGALVLMATHLVEEVQLLGDRVIVLAAGRVMFDGSSAQLAALGEPLRTSDDDQPIEAALRTLRGAADDL